MTCGSVAPVNLQIIVSMPMSRRDGNVQKNGGGGIASVTVRGSLNAEGRGQLGMKVAFVDLDGGIKPVNSASRLGCRKIGIAVRRNEASQNGSDADDL